MRATHRPVDRDPVSLRDEVLECEVQIRKGRQKHRDGLFDALNPTWRAGRKGVIDDMGSDECVDAGHMLVVEHFLIETTRECLVLFGCHVVLFLPSNTFVVCVVAVSEVPSPLLLTV